MTDQSTVVPLRPAQPTRISIINHDLVTEVGRHLRVAAMDANGKVLAPPMTLAGSDVVGILLEAGSVLRVVAVDGAPEPGATMARGTMPWLQGQVSAAIDNALAAIDAVHAYLPRGDVAMDQARIKLTEARLWALTGCGTALDQPANGGH